MPYKISPNPQLRAAAGALTAHGSCPHAIPYYSLNKRALLPDLESPRNLSFDSSAHRPHINMTPPETFQTHHIPNKLSVSLPLFSPSLNLRPLLCSFSQWIACHLPPGQTGQRSIILCCPVLSYPLPSLSKANSAQRVKV